MTKKKLKETYTTSLDPEVLNKFRVYCVLKKRYMNDVLEELIINLLEKEGEGVVDTNK